MMARLCLVSVAMAFLSACALNAPAEKSRTPVETVEAFQTALANGDAAAARGLLSPEVVIYESGGVEATRAEYEKEHLPADMAFLSGASIKLLERRSGESGQQAWVLSRSRISGKYKGKPFDLHSDETAILSRSGGAWLITHIHWSSAPAGK